MLCGSFNVVCWTYQVFIVVILAGKVSIQTNTWKYNLSEFYENDMKNYQSYKFENKMLSTFAKLCLRSFEIDRPRWVTVRSILMDINFNLFGIFLLDTFYLQSFGISWNVFTFERTLI